MGEAPDILVEEPGVTDREELARSQILDLIDREHAVVGHEIEARLSETGRPGGKGGINPHHISNARRQLLEEGLIEAVTAPTKGGRPITVYGLGNRHRRETAFDRAARRKRLLETRYLGWAGGNPETNAIGAAGEMVAHASLQQAATQSVGYLTLSPDGSQVQRLFDEPIPGGPIDNAAHLIAMNLGIPVVITVLVEVKNLRPWLYPTASEMYQLLHKAARVQIQHPDQLIMPILVARQVHYLTRAMAKHLGFFTVTFDNASQPIRNLESVDARFVEEVRQELGYDLQLTGGEAWPDVYRAFLHTVPKQALPTATKWAQMGPPLQGYFARLRDPRLPSNQRESVVDDLYRHAVRITNPSPRWRHAPRHQPAPF